MASFQTVDKNSLSMIMNCLNAQEANSLIKACQDNLSLSKIFNDPKFWGLVHNQKPQRPYLTSEQVQTHTDYYRNDKRDTLLAAYIRNGYQSTRK